MTLRRTLSIGLSIVALTLAACGDDDDDGPGFVYTDDGRLQVMTRNLYLGADVVPLLEAENATSLVVAMTGLWNAVSTTNDFTVRARGIADEIAAARPDLVGLQEAPVWHTQTPSDFLTTGAPATTVAFDFVAMLRNELAARGLPYVVAEEIRLTELEVPVLVSTTVSPNGFMDVRFTDRQVILAIQGLPTSNPRGDVFPTATLLPVPTIDPSGNPTTLLIQRGWTAVDATIEGKKIPFYNVHLESFHDGVKVAQAGVLRATMDAQSAGTTVLVGDFNSDPDGPSPAAYGTLLGADFTDLWEQHGTGQGFTCCFDADLTVTTATLDERIDHILYRGALTPVSVDVVGEEPADRVGDRWPSDHAGVVGTFDP